MGSGIGYVLNRKESPAAPAPAKTAGDSRADFWREFIRVETDRILLVVLFVFMSFNHSSDTLKAAVLGALGMSITQQRYSRGMR